MYCRLLRQTTERMVASPVSREELLTEVPAAVTEEIESSAVEVELGIHAFLPAAWIPGADRRLEILRHLNGISNAEEADDALAMLRDRFGRLPPEAEALVHQFLVRARIAQLGIRRLLYRDDTYLVEYTDRVALERALAADEVEVRPLRAGAAHVVIPADRREPAAALAWIERLLQPPD